MEYCVDALTWLADQPETAHGGLAIVGLSRGGELALELGARSPLVGAVVAAAPSDVRHAGLTESYSDFTQPAWLAATEALPFIPGRYDFRTFVDFVGAFVLRRPIRQLKMFERLIADAVKADPARIDVQRIAGPILLVAGSEDQLWPSMASAERILQRRAEHGGHPADELLRFDGAGHFVCFPYALPSIPPSTRLSPPGPITIDFGGTRSANAAAARESWPKILSFLAACQSASDGPG